MGSGQLVAARTMSSLCALCLGNFASSPRGSLLEGEVELGESQFIPDGEDLLLHGIVDGHAVLAGEAGEIFLLPGGIDPLLAGGLFGGADGTEDVPRFLPAEFFA